MDARDGIHRESEVRLQIPLQRLVQVLELLCLARDFRDVAV